MRLRWIAFVPPAALVTGGLLFLTSSMVSALNASFTPPFDVSTSSAVHRLVRPEAECDFMQRRLSQVTNDLNACDASPGCLRFPLLCSVELHDDLLREKRALQSANQELCSRALLVSDGSSREAARADAGSGSMSDSGCESGDALCAVRLCETPWAGEAERAIEQASSRNGTFLF